eukprot:Lankesteria_metandrocarpae@DN2447_c0_g1_i1.p1
MIKIKIMFVLLTVLGVEGVPRRSPQALDDVWEKIAVLPTCVNHKRHPEWKHKLIRHAIDFSKEMITVEKGFSYDTENKIRTLEEYLLPKVSDRITKFLQRKEQPVPEYVNPLPAAFAKHNMMSRKLSSRRRSEEEMVTLKNPYSWVNVDYDEPVLSYYVLTIFSGSYPDFVAHEFTPFVDSDGESLKGKIIQMNTAIFNRCECRAHTQGLYVFQEIEEGEELRVHEVILEHYSQSASHVRVYIFRRDNPSTNYSLKERARFYEHSQHGDKTPLFVLSARPDTSLNI